MGKIDCILLYNYAGFVGAVSILGNAFFFKGVFETQCVKIKTLGS